MSVNILQAQKEFKKLSYALENPNLKPEDRQKIVVELLDLRGSLVSEFDSVISMISLTEEKIKELKLPKGKYGVLYPLSVTIPQVKNVDTQKVLDILQAEGVDPVTVMKLDTANQQVKSVLETHKDTYTLEDGSRRHSFK